MDRAASEAPVGTVAELHPRSVLVETGALPFGGAGIIPHARSADEGRQEIGGALQLEAAEQRPGYRPRQEREEVGGEDWGPKLPLQEVARRGR